MGKQTAHVPPEGPGGRLLRSVPAPLRLVLAPLLGGAYVLIVPPTVMAAAIVLAARRGAELARQGGLHLFQLPARQTWLPGVSRFSTSQPKKSGLRQGQDPTPIAGKEAGDERHS